MRSQLKGEKRSTIWHRDPRPGGRRGKDGGQWRGMTKVITTLPEIRMEESGREHPVSEREEGWRHPTPTYRLIKYSRVQNHVQAFIGIFYRTSKIGDLDVLSHGLYMQSQKKYFECI